MEVQLKSHRYVPACNLEAFWGDCAVNEHLQ